MGPLFLDCLWLFYLCPLTFSTSAFGACASWGPPSVKAILVYVVGLDRVVFRGALHLLWSFMLGLGGGHMRFGHEDGLPSSCPKPSCWDIILKSFLAPLAPPKQPQLFKKAVREGVAKDLVLAAEALAEKKMCAKEITSVCTLKDRNLFWNRWALESFGAKKKSLRHAAVVNTCCVMRKMLSKPADVKDLQILEKIALLCSGCVPLTSYDASLRSNLNCEQFGMIGSTIYKDLKREIHPSVNKHNVNAPVVSRIKQITQPLSCLAGHILRPCVVAFRVMNFRVKGFYG